jgi:hypothetical protein
MEENRYYNQLDASWISCQLVMKILYTHKGIPSVRMANLEDNFRNIVTT